LYKFVGKKNRFYELDIKLNSNCPDSEKSGTGPGSCGGSQNKSKEEIHGKIYIDENGNKFDFSDPDRGMNIKEIEAFQKYMKMQYINRTNKLPSTSSRSKSISSIPVTDEKQTKRLSEYNKSEPKKTIKKTDTTKSIIPNDITSQKSYAFNEGRVSDANIHSIDNIKIFIDKNGNPVSKDRITKVLSSLPDTLKKQINTIELSGFPSALKSSTSGSSIEEAVIGGVSGFSLPTEKRITLYENPNKDRYIKEYIVHEASHNLDLSLGNGNMWSLTNPAWKKAVDADAKNAISINGHKWSSEYASLVPDEVKLAEDFADTVKQYYRNEATQRAIRSWYPNRIKLIEKLIT